MIRPCPSHQEDRTVKRIISTLLFFLIILPAVIAADKKDEKPNPAQSIDELRQQLGSSRSLCRLLCCSRPPTWRIGALLECEPGPDEFLRHSSRKNFDKEGRARLMFRA
jgi:hypothetical protein